MTESFIIRLLAHSCREKGWKFYAKVYTGRLYKSQPRILDGLAFTPEYEKMRTIGYEVKISRTDFLRDVKWTDYLPVCNSFYFVSPPNIVLPTDLPSGIGLLWLEGENLILKKNARRREIEQMDLQNVLKYLILNRCQTERERVSAMTKKLHRTEKALQAETSTNRKLRDDCFSLQEDIYLLTHPEENKPIQRRRGRESGIVNGTFDKSPGKTTDALESHIGGL